VAIVAPAAAVEPTALAAAEAQWRAAGFRTVRRDDLVAREGYLAGDDARRAGELMTFAVDPAVDALVCARGGYGCQRIVDRLDAAALRKARKPLVGYSDATTLLLWQRRCVGLVGFHGPMLERAAEPGELEALVDALAGSEPLPSVRRGREGGGGSAEGRLVGGSLSLVVASLATPWEIDTRGAILLLEDRGERPYRIDRMLQQLRLAGKLRGVVGIGLGAFVGCDEPDGSATADAVLRECVDALGVPWVAGLPFGHAVPNLPWPMGVRARLDGPRAELHLLERGVARTREDEG
jgi:muramoyltetrapeptide carboxypeptidase